MAKTTKEESGFVAGGCRACLFKVECDRLQERVKHWEGRHQHQTPWTFQCFLAKREDGREDIIMNAVKMGE